MVRLSSTFFDSGLALQVPIQPPLSCLPESRSSSRVLALASSTFNENLELAKSAKQSSPFKPKPRWWIPLFPGASEEWSSKSKPFGDDADSASTGDDACDLQTSSVHIRPRSEAVLERKPRKSSGRARKVVFTPEMARNLRKQMKSDDSFRDFMYHSAIASHLAGHDS